MSSIVEKLVVVSFVACAACTGQLSAGTGIRTVGPYGPPPPPAGEPMVEQGPPPPAQAEVASTPVGGGPAYAAGEDRHWMQADDYFISERPWKSGWMYVHLAKMRQPASGNAKGEAQFFQLDNSRDVWTATFWRTRIAVEADLQLGNFALCFNDHPQNRVYYPPETKNHARTRSWFFGRITDTSDRFKGVVRIDSFDCSVEGVRVPIQ